MTEAGERFLAHVERSLALLDEGIEAVRSMAPERVRIMADLKGHAIAFYAFSRELSAFRERLVEAIGGAPPGVQKIAPVEAARALALTGAFITFVPRLTVRAELESGALVALPIADLPAYHWAIALAYRERKVEELAVGLTREAARSLWPAESDR